MKSKAMAIVTAIKSLYEVGTRFIERGKEFFVGKKERHVEPLINYIPDYEKIQMDTTFKGYTREEIISDCIQMIKRELFQSKAVDVLYNLIVITIAKIVKKLLTKVPVQMKGDSNATREVIFEGENKEVKNRKFTCGVKPGNYFSL